MHQEQRQRTHELLKTKGIDRALFAHPHSVTWLTGFVAPLQTGRNLFAGGPSLVWYEDGHYTLVVLDGYTADVVVFDAESDGTAITYPGYTIERPIASAEHLVDTLGQLVGASGNGGKVGIEVRDLTALLSNSLKDTLSPATEFVPIDDWLVPLRMVKTGEELAKLKANFALTDIGHKVARTAVQVGQREIDVWMAIHSAINRTAGQRVPLGNDCVVGHREANIGGWPLDHELGPKDSLIIDLSAILYGYWSDSCATYYATDPTPQQVAMHQTVAEALEFAISLCRPGAVAKDIDRQVRQFIEDAGYPVYPHHTGHGVGVSGHEAPRIVPYSEEVLQEDMVIMLEPGIYLPGEMSVRLEDAILVTAGGAEVLTKHDKRLP